MAWKVYAWCMAVLAAVTLGGRIGMHLRRPGSVARWDHIEAGMNLVLLAGLFGFAYERALGSRLFWEVAVPAAWAGLVYGLFSPTHRKLAREKGARVAALAGAASLAMNLPGLLAVTLYAYARPGIWK